MTLAHYTGKESVGRNENNFYDSRYDDKFIFLHELQLYKKHLRPAYG